MTILIPKSSYPEFMSFLHKKGIQHDYDATTNTIFINQYGEISFREYGYLADENVRPLVLEFFACHGD